MWYPWVISILKVSKIIETFDNADEGMQELHGFFKKQYKYIVGFQPTGWAFGKSISKMTRRRSGPMTIYAVPYRFLFYKLQNLFFPSVNIQTMKN